MRRWRRIADYSIDDSVNMGYIGLRRQKRGTHGRCIEVKDGGRCVFILDIDIQERLTGIECFNAERQLGVRRR